MVWLCELFCKKSNTADDAIGPGRIQIIDTPPDEKLHTRDDVDFIDGRSSISIDINPPNTIKGKKLAVIPTHSEEAMLNETLVVYEKDDDAKNLIRLAIGKNDFLNNMMDDERLNAVTMAMYPREYERDQIIIQEGEIGEHLFISAHGIYDVIKNNIVIRNFGVGVAFGELGVLYQTRRFATIRARTSAKVWILNRTVFHRIMIELGRIELDENISFLKSVEALTGLSDEKYSQVADLLKRNLYSGGTPIVKQGDEGDLFYIIRAGKVKVVKRDADGKERVVNTLTRGDCFGEQALLHRERRLATVIAEPPGTECLTLDRVAFHEYLGTLDELKLLPVDVPIKEPTTPNDTIESKYNHIQFKNLVDIRTLGVGSYGRVKLVEDKPTKERFALKYLKKHEIVQLKYERHVYNEKDIMTSCDSNFIVRLYKTYRDSKYLYFLMEACLGGDLWTVLYHNRYFDDGTSRFIMACVIEGVGYLHSRNMVYRDLKPENLMIDDRGYIKLVDFGFARRIEPPLKTNTFVGTPEYVAPEIILGKGHDRAVDYWAIGILVHELLSGKPAFRGQDHIRTYNLIVRGIDSVIMPTRISRNAQDLIKKLCRKIPTERLGYAKNGVTDIKEHGWFNGFHWDKVRDQIMTAPRQLSDPKVSFEVYPNDEENTPAETSGWDIYF